MLFRSFCEKFKVGICFTGCGYQGSPKYLAWIYNYDTEQVELMKLPYSLSKQLSDFCLDEEYSFTEFPMPYDLKIKATNAGTKEVQYTMLPRMKKAFAVDGVEIDKLKSCAEIIESMKEKQKDKVNADRSMEKLAGQKPEYPQEDINPDDIPF